MTKKKNYVKIESNENNIKNNETYGKDEKGRIIKIEQKGNPGKRGNTRRRFSVLCWLIAIVFEVIGILRLTDVIQRFSSLKLNYFIIICICLDLIFFITGSLLWKKANHIDPISEKNKTKFWFWNNLGTVLSILAFLPMIIFVFTNKKIDKKSKSFVGGIAIVALAIAGLTSYDYNPVSIEQLQKAEQEVLQVSPSGTIYRAPYSKKYHVDKDCPAFSNSETVYEGTVRDAYERGLTDPCRRCIPEYKGVEYEDNEDNTEQIDDKEIGDILTEIIEEIL